MATPDRLAALMGRAILAAVQDYARTGNVARWERAMQRAIADGHAAAAIAGTAERLGVREGSALLNTRNLSRAERRAIQDRVAGQLPYLRAFAEQVRTGEKSDAQLAAQSALYAGATRATYYESRHAGYDLRDVPIPADGGTSCLSNCKCVAYVEGGQWVYETTAAEHCPECLARAARSPYPLRRSA